MNIRHMISLDVDPANYLAILNLEKLGITIPDETQIQTMEKIIKNLLLTTES